MQIVIMIVGAMLILTALIVAHEFGHYIAAKKNGIRVSEFAVGFGPRLIKWHRGETEFSIRPIFFGGYVRFADDPEEDPVPGDFRAASLKARAITAVAGPAANVIVAVVLAIIMLLCAPEMQAVRIARVEPDSPAAEAGLIEGDILKELGGIDMDFYSSALTAYQSSPKTEDIDVRYVRDGQTYETTVHLENKEDLMGIFMESAPYNFFEACALSFKWLGQQTYEVLSALGNLFFRGSGIENMTGVVGTTVVVGNVLQYGTAGILLMLVALISINLAIVNLLPIPALDGGKLVLYAVEGVRKKPAPERLEGILNFVGLAAIMCLAVFLVFQDVSRLTTGGF